MNVTVTLEHRFVRASDGTVWTQTMFAYPFWTRYLEVFDQVCAVARIHNVTSVSGDWKRADGEQVVFVAVPNYLGPGQYVSQFTQVHRAVRAAVQAAEALIFRVPSQLATGVMSCLRRKGRPYGAEVLGDPYDVFAPGVVCHPLRPFFRWWFTRQLRYQCAHACAASYVTKSALQRRYPPGLKSYATHYSSGVFTTSYSDVDLAGGTFAARPCVPKAGQSTFRLVTVGSLAQMYKAPDVLIDAVSICVRQNLDLTLVIVGDGKYRQKLEKRTASYGLSKRIRFLGQLSAGQAVRDQLDQADLFVLASRTEGLPRAMIEAMARGLPCIGSTVGGVPELLPPEDMVTPDDAQALARKIREVLTNPGRMVAMSARNLEKANEYNEDILRKRRLVFYGYLRDKTEAWIKKQS